MKNLNQVEKRFPGGHQEKGATLVEYVLIIGLISLVIVGVLATPLGDGIETFANNIQDQLTSASAPEE